MISPVTPEDSVRVEADLNHPSRWLAHVGDFTIPVSAEGSDHRLRTRDIDFARWLEFKRPRAIRQLIRRMVAEGKLSAVECRHTVGRQSVGRNGSGVREFHAEEYWLTREQALLVATQSGTSMAWKVTERMVKVFLAVEAMQSPVVVASTFDTAMIGRMIAQAVDHAVAATEARIRGELRAELDARQIGDGVTLTRRGALAEVLHPLRALARRFAKADPLFSRASHCGRLHVMLRDALSVRLHLAWTEFPAARLGEVRSVIAGMTRALDDREGRLTDAAKAENRAKQTALPFGSKN